MAVRSFYSTNFLRISLGIFFIVLGIYGISQNINEGMFGLNNPASRNNQTIEIIFGVIELFCGILMLSGLFALGSRSAVNMGTFIVFVLWVVRIVFTHFIWGLVINDRGISFRPDIYQWILSLATGLVIAFAISAVMDR